jgi:hypothetical protein
MVVENSMEKTNMNLKNHIKNLTLIINCICFLMLSGCAASRALNKEDRKDYSVLEKGTERDLVLAELGVPIVAGAPHGSNADSRCDIFAFREGVSGAKYARAVGYSFLAVGTLGISEIVTNPVESAIGNDKIRLRVCYDENLRVDTVSRLEAGVAAIPITSVKDL